MAIIHTNSKNNNTPSVVIVGGGPAGLALAAHLLSKGWTSVSVLERRSRESLLADTNSFYDMSSSGIQALLRIADGAAAQAVFDQAVAYKTITLYGSEKDEPIPLEWRSRSLGMPTFNVSRAAMLEALVEALEALDPHCIQYETIVRSVNHEKGTVEIEGKTEPIQADLIVGADGIHSKIRKQVFGDSGLRSDGIVACYATLPPLTEEERKAFPHPSSERMNESYGIMGYQADYIDYAVVNKTATIWYSNFIYDGKPHTTLPPTPDRPGGWLGEVRHRSTTSGSSIPVVQALLDRTTEDQVLVTMCNDRPPMKTYHAGHVVLVGDAAHPFTPFAGLGSSQAMVDAFVLAEALLHCGTVEQAVVKYEGQRLKAANTLMDESRAMCGGSALDKVFYWFFTKFAFPVARRLDKVEALLDTMANDSSSLVNSLVPLQSKEEEAAYQSRYDKAKASLEAQLHMEDNTSTVRQSGGITGSTA